MEVDTFQSLATAGGSTAGAADGLGGFEKNFETFLTLLTAQLQNQDPLSPMDANEFTNQLVRFSAVEQAIKTNAKLDDLLGVQKAGQAASAVGYLGKEVEVQGNGVPLVNGQAVIGYSLSATATGTAIVITDLDGTVVRTIQGETTAGPHTLVWDGLDLNGQQLPDGVYAMRASAVDAEGGLVNVTTTFFGLVDGVASTETGIVLSVGDIGVKLDDVVAVREPQPQTDPST